MKLTEDYFHDLGTTVQKVAVVGSYCFNLPDPGDLDLYAIAGGTGLGVDETTQREKVLNKDYIEIRRGYVESFLKKINLSSGLDFNIISQKWETRQSDLGFSVPWYDVNEGILYHKEPYAQIPFHFSFDPEKRVFTVKMRDKITKAMNLLF